MLLCAKAKVNDHLYQTTVHRKGRRGRVSMCVRVRAYLGSPTYCAYEYAARRVQYVLYAQIKRSGCHKCVAGPATPLFPRIVWTSHHGSSASVSRRRSNSNKGSPNMEHTLVARYGRTSRCRFCTWSFATASGPEGEGRSCDRGCRCA
eukprot:349660-Chlamydomonas_euryale.AAC.3